MQLLSKINSRYASLSPSEQRVATYIQNNIEEIVSLSLGALAARCGTSDTTIIRFCRSLGYSGFQDMKSVLIPELLRKGVYPSSNTETGLRNSYHSRLSEDVMRTMDNNPENTMNEVAKALLESKRNVLLGLAGSGGVARIFGDSLFSVGLTAITLSDRVEIERMCESVEPKDVIFGISHSGENPEVCSGLERGKARGAITVGMTNYSPSSLSRSVDYLFLTSVAESMLGSYSCHPRVLELVLLEILMNNIAGRLKKHV